jgi:hypothetical protein
MVITMLVGNLFFLNLIIAILVDGYKRARETELDRLHDHPEDIGKPPAIVGVGTEVGRWVVKMWRLARLKMAIVPPGEDDEDGKDKEKISASGKEADGEHTLISGVENDALDQPHAATDEFGDGLGPLASRSRLGMREGLGFSFSELPPPSPAHAPARVLLRTGTKAQLQKVCLGL